MSLPRTIGYVGIALLLTVAAFGVFVAFAKHDWYGFFVMVGFIGILAFFWHALRAAARRERDPALHTASGLGWYGEPLGALVRGPVLHTLEGLVFVCGSAISLLYAVLASSAPSMVALNPARASINSTLFCLWPILLFVVYVKFCGPHFRQSLYSSLVLLCAAGFPFYLAYK
jgi:hypothetical protein